MSAANLCRLFLLAAIWGGSYVLMRVVAPVFGGIGTMWLRISTAGAALLIVAAITGEDLQFRQRWKQYLFIGVMNSAIPFALIAFAMKTLPAGYGAILNALSPFFAALFAAWMLDERLSAARMLGMTLGFIGVGMVMNLGPIAPTAATLTAAAACIAATISYGFISVYLKKYAKGAPNMGIAAGALILPALLTTPLGLFSVPPVMPEPRVLVCLILLALVCSSFAHLLYYQLIRNIGPTKAISVTFLIPLFGVAWGALWFGETLNLGAIAGGAVILLGVSLVLGVPPPRRNSQTA